MASSIAATFDTAKSNADRIPNATITGLRGCAA